MKRYIDGLVAVHDVTGSLTRAVERGNSDFDIEEMRRKLPPVEHPVVRIHPETGRPLLYVNAASTAYLRGVQEREGATVLQLLCDVAGSPELQCRVRGARATWCSSTTSACSAAVPILRRAVVPRHHQGDRPTRSPRRRRADDDGWRRRRPHFRRVG
jgi:taurine dioxygenase